MPYNPRVSKAYWLLICAPFLMAAACEKKPPKDTGSLPPQGSGSALAVDTGPVGPTPLNGESDDKQNEHKKNQI